MSEQRCPTPNVEMLPPHDRMTVEEALAYAGQEHLTRGYDDAMVVAFASDGVLVIRSSSMTRAMANWMLDLAKVHSLNLAFYDEFEDETGGEGDPQPVDEEPATEE